MRLRKVHLSTPSKIYCTIVHVVRLANIQKNLFGLWLSYFRGQVTRAPCTIAKAFFSVNGGNVISVS